ncbi:MAG: DUF4381 family protein [Verrucomicrobia bacterium]|nr:MAG: DUF4381 family protein [Verrucomicrobiota bacterium]
MNARSQRPEVRGQSAAVWLSVLLTFKAVAQVTNDIPPLIPAYPEIPPTFWEQHGSAIILASLATLLVMGIIIWLLLRPKPVVVLPPEVQARQALELLRQQNEDGNVLSEVSQVLRRYLVAAFEMSPDELTTSEFCHALQQSERIGDELTAAVSDFLRRCDEWKFSPATMPVPLGAATQALALVELSEARRVHLRQLVEAQSKPESASPA